MRSGEIAPGDVIAEATSGNTGISFAAIGRALGPPGAHLHAGLDVARTRAGDPEPRRRGDPRVGGAGRIPRLHPHGRRFRARGRPRVPPAAVRQHRQRAGALRDHRSRDHRAAGHARAASPPPSSPASAPAARSWAWRSTCARRFGRRGRASARARELADAAHRSQGGPASHPGHQRRIRALHRQARRRSAASSTSGMATPS